MNKILMEQHLRNLRENNHKLSIPDPTKNSQKGVHKGSYRGYEIFYSNEGEWADETHIDDNRYKRISPDFSENSVLMGTTHLIDELFYGEITNPENHKKLKEYDRLKNQRTNGYVKICLVLKKYWAKILMSTFNTDINKTIYIHTIYKKAWKEEDVDLKLNLKENVDDILVFTV